MLRHIGWLIPFTIAFIVAVFAATGFTYYAQHAIFSPDPWSVYDMALSLGEQFYRIFLVRQFFQPVDYGASYPPLAPALVFLLDRISGLGIYAHFIISAVAGWCVILGLYPVLRKASGEGRTRALLLSVLLLAIVVFNIEELYRDIYRASTIPIALALIVGALLLIPSDGGMTARRAFAVGVVMGLAALTRFDVNLFILAFTAAVAVAAARRWPAMIAYGAGVLLAVSPWIAYSLVVFHKPYVSDNSIVAIAVRQLISYALILPGEPTIFNDPAGWMSRITRNWWDFLSILQRMLAGAPFAWGFLAAVPVVGVLIWGWGRTATGAFADVDGPEEGHGHRYRLMLAATAIASLLLFVGPVLTGYQIIVRYYSMTFVLWAVALLAWGIGAMHAAERRLGHTGPRLAFEAAVVALCLGGLVTLPREAYPNGRVETTLAFDPANRTIDTAGFFQHCLPADGRTLVRYEIPGFPADDSMRFFLEGVRFGVMARRTLILQPANWSELQPPQRQGFLADLRVTHTLLPPTANPACLNDLNRPVEPVEGCPGLYRVLNGD